MVNQLDRESSLKKIVHAVLPEKKKIILDGKSLTVRAIEAVARKYSPVEFTTDPKTLKQIQQSYDAMMNQVKNAIPIYGCNTGYGARASHIVTNGTEKKRIELARKVSEGIVHIDVTTGPRFDKDIIRAGMLIRINMLLQGISAVKLADLEIYRNMLNKNITPIVSQYGGIGASGDLAHNSRVLSAARQLKGTKVWDAKNREGEAKDVLQKAGIPALKIDPKAGLGLVNGDNFSTAVATLLAIDTIKLFIIANITSAIIIEALKGSDRSFHPLLAEFRPHMGQKDIATLYRYLLEGSSLAYQEMKGHKRRPKGIKVQDGYSLRCLSQYHAVNVDKLASALDVITINANSVSDNPLWVPPDFTTPGEEPWQWVSGGNFIAMHMVETIDGLRKTLTQTVKLNDRLLSRLVNPHENNELPANLSDEKALTQCSFKGVQIQSGMFDVYSSLLSIPVSTFFGVHEENNQDITSHALTSGILGLENLRIARYSTAQNLMAAIQAVDLRGGQKLMSPKTQPVYDYVRNLINYVDVERPLGNDIETIYQEIVNGRLYDMITDTVLKDLING